VNSSLRSAAAQLEARHRLSKLLGWANQQTVSISDLAARTTMEMVRRLGELASRTTSHGLAVPRLHSLAQAIQRKDSVLFNSFCN
jgi:hypothetical protein